MWVVLLDQGRLWCRDLMEICCKIQILLRQIHLESILRQLDLRQTALSFRQIRLELTHRRLDLRQTALSFLLILREEEQRQIQQQLWIKRLCPQLDLPQLHLIP